jgi:FkbM family methyltransferase
VDTDTVKYSLGADGLYRPAYDVKLQQVDNWVEDAGAARDACPLRRVAVQAGGAYGVWPLWLSQYYRTVYTFEPDAMNFAALAWNCRSRTNVHAMRAALGDAAGFVDVVRDECEANNAGAGYVVDADVSTTPRLRLDLLELHVLDLLCLDVEGAECEALGGARVTIDRCRPVIMLEAKLLPHMERVFHVGAEDAVKWLVKHHGYHELTRRHRDVVLVPRERVS